MSVQLLCGDSRKELLKLPPNSVNLIVTSPPYADQRKNTYGGITPKEYVKWFLPISEQLLRVLKPAGTFILNIKERIVSGERSTYVIELVLEMRKQGWLWTEEFIWHKKNCFPGKWPNRFRDAWERLLQFNKEKYFAMYQEAVMIPAQESTLSRAGKLRGNDITRYESGTGSKMGRNMQKTCGRERVYPSNVLYLSTECGNKNHSAAFPYPLPEWFIRLFTKEGDTVLDPFMGSGTAILAAHHAGRNGIGIDIIPEYFDMVKRQIEQQPELF